jgi:hypothetical protein
MEVEGGDPVTAGLLARCLYRLSPQVYMIAAKKRHEDTSVCLYPLRFEEAIAALAHAPKHTDSAAEESGTTQERGAECGP